MAASSLVGKFPGANFLPSFRKFTEKSTKEQKANPEPHDLLSTTKTTAIQPAASTIIVQFSQFSCTWNNFPYLARNHGHEKFRKFAEIIPKLWLKSLTRKNSGNAQKPCSNCGEVQISSQGLGNVQKLNGTISVPFNFPKSFLDSLIFIRILTLILSGVTINGSRYFKAKFFTKFK
jgi:hypothetical protein